MRTDELRAVATRVMELRQELESVEARLRELSGDGAPLAPIESMDSPTVLTTNHAQRRADRDRRMPFFAALGGVAVLAGGIGIGYALRAAPPPEPPAAPLVAVPVATVVMPPPPVVPVEPLPPSATVTAPPAASITPSRPVVVPPRSGNIDRGF
jgi:hypothetical protein